MKVDREKLVQAMAEFEAGEVEDNPFDVERFDRLPG